MAKTIHKVAAVVAVAAQIGAFVAAATGQFELAATFQTIAAVAGAVAAVSGFIAKPPSDGCETDFVEVPT